jgi:5-formyltetrahydrofolate cyclo-ligase
MDKETFRKICIDKAKRKRNINRCKLDSLVNHQLYQYIKKHKVKTIMLYIPLEIEIDISNLIFKLRREGKLLLVPFMEGESFSLVKYRLPLRKKQFGVKEPQNTNRYKYNIDLAIVPIIGTDSTLKRVGFGKGFYDRFFAKNRNRIGKIIFVGRAYCVSSEIISDDHDVIGDTYMTPKNCHKKNYLSRNTRI